MTTTPTPDGHEDRFWSLAEPMLSRAGVTRSTMMLSSTWGLRRKLNAMKQHRHDVPQP